jgi:hypothetical protein
MRREQQQNGGGTRECSYLSHGEKVLHRVVAKVKRNLAETEQVHAQDVTF